MLTADSLYVSYGKIEVLHGLSFSVSKGEIVAILGPNGCGKSTTLKAVSGLLVPKGTVRLGEQDITTMSVGQRVKRGITFIPQGRNVFGSMTVEENLLLGAFSRNDREQIATDLEFWFDFFPQLGEKRRQRAGELSGGQRGMVAIARGLMARPSLLLLDEPSLGVAPIVLQELSVAIRRLRDELQLTMVLVEQDVPFALGLADRVLVLSGGRVALDDVPDNLRDGQRLRDVYFGVSDGHVAASDRGAR